MLTFSKHSTEMDNTMNAVQSLLNYYISLTCIQLVYNDLICHNMSLLIQIFF